MQNIYFVVMASAKTEAEAIQEAYEITKHVPEKTLIEVRECGSKRLIARVHPSGTVSPPNPDGDKT